MVFEESYGHFLRALTAAVAAELTFVSVSACAGPHGSVGSLVLGKQFFDLRLPIIMPEDDAEKQIRLILL